VVFRQPIPADQTVWGTGSGLNIWNLNVSRETWISPPPKKSGRSQIEQQVGDYWSACMDEKGIDASALRDLAPELHNIAAIKDSLVLLDEVAHLHSTLPGAWEGATIKPMPPMFGFGSRRISTMLPSLSSPWIRAAWRFPVATSI